MKKLALRIVREAFADKKDLAGEPYINHLMRVANNVKLFFQEEAYLEEVEVIALLHDLLEDCPEWTKSHLMSIFGSISLVSSVLKLRRVNGQTYEEYINYVSVDRFSRAVKLADLKDNMDLTRLKEITEKDIERTKKYHKAYMFLMERNKK